MGMCRFERFIACVYVCVLYCFMDLAAWSKLDEWIRNSPSPDTVSLCCNHLELLFTEHHLIESQQVWTVGISLFVVQPALCIGVMPTCIKSKWHMLTDLDEGFFWRNRGLAVTLSYFITATSTLLTGNTRKTVRDHYHFSPSGQTLKYCCKSN